MTELAVAVTTAWLSNPQTRASSEDVCAFLTQVRATLDALKQGSVEVEPAAGDRPDGVRAAVTARKSLADPSYIISLIDGKPYRTLRRHLSTHELTPETYRDRYGLKPDYPMVAPDYSAARSKLAKERGLGRKRAAPQTVAPVATAVVESSGPSTPPKTRRPQAKKTVSAA
nr:MucR family transcriptional regulator [Aureimonas ureilytica]